MCCGPGTLLLDTDQQVPQQRDEFQARADQARLSTRSGARRATSDTCRQLRYRFWYERYSGQRNVMYTWWSTSAKNPEYDVPPSAADCDDAATPHRLCVHEIRSKFNGARKRAEYFVTASQSLT